ncbi:hypothetical protein HB825_09640 [Listeria booriae]|nr:Ig-like domain-containing protein [Listeria booriae]MBC6135094.1 hypothetical protein [Listeria booriae]
MKIGSNIVDATTEATLVSTLENVPASRNNIVKNYSTTFTARSTETRVEILVAKTMNYQGVNSAIISGGVSITPTDTTAPDAPTVTPVYDTDTNIKGSGEANCDVKVTLESGDVVTGRTDASGNFDITIPVQAAGKEIKVTLTDGAGNESNPTTVTVLATAIATPTIGAVTTDDTTVKGTGIKGATVTVTIGSQDYTATVDQSGNYSVTILKQAVGTEITAKQTSSGKTSDSVSTTVTQGTIAPPTIGTVTTNDTTVRGTGLPGQRVYYKVGSADWYEYDYATVAADGTYMFYISPQQVGTQISVKHTVGGVDSALATTTVIQGTVAAPTISAVTTDDTTVK